MVQVLFVCYGNICRSPTAQGLLEHLTATHGLTRRISVDSAGTSGIHAGEPPDPRTIAAAQRRGIDLSRQRARQITRQDYDRFDYILAMDRDNLRALRRQCPPDHLAKVGLFLEYAPHTGMTDVPDPYYDGPEAFDLVLDLASEAAKGLLATLRHHHRD